jgi:hypothetical protein
MSNVMGQHVENLLALRDGTAEGETEYRRQVMRLLGAVPAPDLGPLLQARQFARRVEGTIGLTGAGDDGKSLLGMVMFAVGNGGAGALADVRNKDGGNLSARSVLVDRPEVDVVLLVTTHEPPQELFDVAEEKSDLVYIGSTLRRSIWVMGLPEIVGRADAFIRLSQENEEKPFFARFKDWLLGSKEESEVPRSPLLLR